MEIGGDRGDCLWSSFRVLGGDGVRGRGCRSPREWRLLTALSVAPVMAEMISSVVTSPTRNSPLLRPSRSTTTRSATAFTSSMLWLIRMTPWPRSRSRSTRLSTSAVCATPSAAVGSSRMMSFGSPRSERAIATVWRWPPDSDAIGIRTDGIFAESCRSSSQARTSIADLVELGAGAARDRGKVLHDVELSQRARSWNTVAMPRFQRGGRVGRVTRSPPKVDGRPCRSWTPESTLTRVDFPAPLSPTIATTSLESTSRSMSVRAATAPKLLLMPPRERTCGGPGARGPARPGASAVLAFTV